jgi:hypothetical protein
MNTKNPITNETVRVYAEKLVESNLENLYLTGMDDKKVLKDIEKLIPTIVHWIHDYLRKT